MNNWVGKLIKLKYQIDPASITNNEQRRKFIKELNTGVLCIEDLSEKSIRYLTETYNIITNLKYLFEVI